MTTAALPATTPAPRPTAHRAGPAATGDVRQRFLQIYWTRHDELEVLLDRSGYPGEAIDAMRDAAAILRRIIGSATAIGLDDLVHAAQLVENHIRTRMAEQIIDFHDIRGVLNAYLDISMQVCNPTERVLDAD